MTQPSASHQEADAPPVELVFSCDIETHGQRCRLPIARVVGNDLVIAARHHGVIHLGRIPLAVLAALWHDREQQRGHPPLAVVPPPE